MSRHFRRRGTALATIASAFALLAFAPGALAATLTVDGSGNLVYTAGAGHVSAIEFDETAANTVQVHAVSGGSVVFGGSSFGPFTDDDTITPSGNCSAIADDGNGDPTFECTGVTGSVQATTLDGNDGVDATGEMTGLTGADGLTNIPLVADMGDGNDAVLGGLANDTLHGGANEDDVAGDTGGTSAGSDDHLFGDAGDDLVAGGKGADTIDGGAGNDSAVGGPGNDSVNGGDDADSFVAGGPGNDTVDGGAGDDSVFGDCGGTCGTSTAGDDTVSGGAGEDYVLGEAGNDTVSGGDDDDYVAGDCDFSTCSSGSAGNDSVSGDAGDDTVNGEAGDDIVHGGDGSDDVNGDNDRFQAGADQAFGDAGDDDVRTQAGNDTADGGDGNDFVAGGQGDDTVSGGAGADDVEGASGTDVVDGGVGDDFVDGDCGNYSNCGDGADGNDTVTGGPGDDSADADGGTDSIDLGTGNDIVYYPDRIRVCDPGCHQVSYPVSVTLDGAANDGGAGENDNVLGTEDVQVYDACCGSPPPGGDATIAGDAGTNQLTGGEGNDIIDGGAGNDFLNGSGGNDTINANDGFADRVSCGEGNDTANVDEFDIVSDSCETVNRTTRGNLATEDAPPAVAWTAPASGAKMSTSAANTLTVTATDDKGISQVVFMAGERVICTVTAAPYTCAYKPTDADVGRTTLVAIAIDTSQQTASAVRVVTVPRFKPSKVTSKTTPKKDSKAPFTFTTKGKVNLPSGVSAAAGCTGTVAVTFKAGKKTISTRKAKVSKSCTFRSKVTFSIPSRLHPKSLRVQSTFRGNAVLTSRASSRSKVKVS